MALLLAGCGSDDSGSSSSAADTLGDAPSLPDAGGSWTGDLPKPGQAQVNTRLSASALELDEQAEVTCAVTPDDWDGVPTVVTLVSGPAETALIEDHSVTFSAPGVYELACEIDGTNIVDATPAKVTVSEGGPSAVETELAPNPVSAGEPVEVTCSAVDRDGNAAGAHFAIEITPEEGWELDGTTLTATRAQDYDVACRAIEGDVVDDSPVRLQVQPGPLAQVRAELAEEEIDAGGGTTVACLATDAHGNGVAGHSFYIEADEGVEVDTDQVSATVAGLHQVGCRLADGDDSAIEHEDATLTVRPGPAAVVTLTPIPARDAYRVNTQVTLESAVADAYGNPVANAELTPIAIDPVEGVTALSENVFRFTAEGVFTFSTTVTGVDGVGAELALVCDGAGPSVVIDYPLRGATIDGAPTVVVTGAVVDEVSGVETFTINGAEVLLSEEGAFEFAVEAVHGLNILATEAIDGAGRMERSWRSFYFSDAWYPADAADPAAAAVDDAIMAFLGAETLDSDDPEAVDLAGLLAGFVQTIDVMALIPQPAAEESVAWCDYEIYLDSLSYGTPQLGLTPFGPSSDGQPGGITVRVTLPNFVAHAEATAPGACIDAGAEITASRIVLEVDLFLQVENGESVAYAQVGDARFDDLDVDVDGVLGWFSNWLVNFFEGTISDLIVEQLAAVIEGEVSDMLSEVLAMLSLGEQFEIPPLVGDNNPVVLALQADLTELKFSSGGGVARLAGSVLSDKLVDRDPLGSIGRGSCSGGSVGVYELPGEHGLEASLYDDLVNQALFAFWYGGGLDLVVTAEDLAALAGGGLPIDIQGLQTRLLLPPILEGCPDDGVLHLQLGDAYVETQFDFLGQHVELGMYVQLAAQATLGVFEGETGPELGVTVGDVDTIEIEVVSINDEQAGKEQTYADLLKGLVPTLLGEVAGEPITFAIPSFDLAGFVDNIPAGQWVTLTPDSLERVLGRTVVAGHLSPGTPPAVEEPPVEEPPVVE